ncbi:MAG: hypothetical protein A2V83_05765 [Nitrospirae bacterium RBG_16_64_22]|nr:MAG: hypothetical protein A2V83_05765 [Nitrospirae bacterium RBG_16_64_22]
MRLGRVLRHLFSGPWLVRGYFPKRSLDAIEEAIRKSEVTHRGELRFAVEAAIEWRPLFRGQTARQRAIEVFSQLRVWDTEENSGVLIYLLLADRDVEIVADRGIDARVGAAEWERICKEMESLFRQGRFEEGVVTGIAAITEHLARHFPARKGDQNELPDRPVVL